VARSERHTLSPGGTSGRPFGLPAALLLLCGDPCHQDRTAGAQFRANLKTGKRDVGWRLALVNRTPGSPRRASRHLGLKPVSADVRTGLCSRARIAPRKGLARPETGAAIRAPLSDFGRQRPRSPASPATKPRKVKDYSGGVRKPELRRTAWWAREDSNLQSAAYENENPAIQSGEKRASVRIHHEADGDRPTRRPRDAVVERSRDGRRRLTASAFS
jgi:hypothetical protein